MLGNSCSSPTMYWMISARCTEGAAGGERWGLRTEQFVHDLLCKNRCGFSTGWSLHRAERHDEKHADRTAFLTETNQQRAERQHQELRKLDILRKHLTLDRSDSSMTLVEAKRNKDEIEGLKGNFGYRRAMRVAQLQALSSTLFNFLIYLICFKTCTVIELFLTLLYNCSVFEQPLPIVKICTTIFDILS